MNNETLVKFIAPYEERAKTWTGTLGGFVLSFEKVSEIKLGDEKRFNHILDLIISDMKANIAAQGQKINEINEKIRTVENQISIVEENVKVTETNIVVVEEKIAEREQKIEDMNNKIKERMAAEQSNVSSNNYIKFIMGATSFVDLFRRISALNEITGYDKQKIDEMEAEKVLLEQDKVELENQKIELEKQKAEGIPLPPF